MSKPQGIRLSPPPQSRDYKHGQQCSAFSKGFWGSNPCLHACIANPSQTGCIPSLKMYKDFTLSQTERFDMMSEGLYGQVDQKVELCFCCTQKTFNAKLPWRKH